VFAARSVGGAEPAAPDRAFVEEYCASCHNDVDNKGRLDLTRLEFVPSDPANLAVWIKVHDRLKAGEMPPRNRARPDATRQKAFIQGLARSIVDGERAALAGEGRAIRRRLNRHEYENAVRDLLGVPWARIADRLPEDGEAGVRDLEHRLQESRGWARRPKPRVKANPPIDPASPAQYMAKVQIMYDLARLALETDSTRAITLTRNGALCSPCRTSRPRAMRPGG
jgi:hypothetical protein